MYISKRVRSGGIFARLLSCINPRSRKSDFELTSILFAPICFGPEGTQLLKFVARAAFNRCVDTGATLVAIATAGGNEIATGLSVEELLSNVVIELQMEFSMLGKPIAEQLPKLTRDSIFIDPRW